MLSRRLNERCQENGDGMCSKTLATVAEEAKAKINSLFCLGASVSVKMIKFKLAGLLACLLNLVQCINSAKSTKYSQFWKLYILTFVQYVYSI